MPFRRHAERGLRWHRLGLPGRDHGPALVTVVVPATDQQADHLDECLDSLRNQNHKALQIVVATHGTSRAVGAIAARHASEDWRIQVVGDGPGGVGDARNTGARHARGRYLMFVGAADILPAAAISRLVTSLEASGSDLALGRITQPSPATDYTKATRDRIHRRTVQATDLTETPDVIADLFVENKLFRRDFWRSAEIAFPAAAGSMQGLSVMRAYLAAADFDVLSQVVYHWKQRGDGLPVGHERHCLGELDEWLRAQRETEATLRAGVPPVVREAWLRGVLDGHAPRFIDDAELMSGPQWESLSAAVRHLSDLAGAELLARVRVEPRVKAWLTATGRRAQLESFVADRRLEIADLRTRVIGTEVTADFPTLPDPDVPDSVVRLQRSETPLVASLRGARWPSRTTMELDVYAFVAHVDLDGVVPVLEVAAVDELSGTRVDLPVEQYVDPGVNRFAGHRFQDYANGAFKAQVDAARLVSITQEHAGDAQELRWSLELTLHVAGVSRAGSFSHRDLQGSAGGLGLRLVDGFKVGPRGDDSTPLELVARRADVVMVEAELGGRRLRGRIDATAGLRVVTLELTRPQGADSSVPVDEHGRFTLDFPDVGYLNHDVDVRHWVMRARTADGDRHRLAWPPGNDDSWLHGPHATTIALRRTSSGDCEAWEVGLTPFVDDLRLANDRLVLQGHWLWPPAVPWSLSLRNDGYEVEGDGKVHEDGRFEVEFDLTADRWGLGRTPLPTGEYWLTVTFDLEGGPHATQSLPMSAGLLGRTPYEAVGNLHLLRVARTPRNRVAIRLAPPLTDDERGPLAQHRLQEQYAREDEVDPGAVYLQSYHGDVATDSQRAIHEELRRSRPELTLYWGVSDYSVVLPDGAVPVLIRSRAWYDVLGRSAYLVNNIDFPHWFRKRPGQRFLQTFHGYPSKSMGLRMWRAKEYPPSRIEHELDRTSRDWDLILTPAPEMDEHYRREYAYDGPILSAGYPRDDAIVGPDAERIRTDTRERLGITDSQTVVLYAPTWRDNLATSWRSAPLVRHLDLEAASQRLGEDFVFLMRGHRFHVRRVDRARRTARIIDVTEYPEVNDLILAADAAVLDYSSLRFDFALTRRPMIFLVPDLHLYTGGVRGFLYDFGSTAPGPWLDTADQVVAALGDLDKIAADYAARYQRFHETYNYLQDGDSARRTVEEFIGPPGRAGGA